MIEISVEKRLAGADGPLDLKFAATIQRGELVTIYGPTGGGKTSLLRMLAGLLNPDQGFIRVEGNTWFDATYKTCLTPQARNIGMVFQDYSLFPNMTVRGNLEFALEKDQDRTIVDQLLEISGLANLQHKRPHTLSGGQKQRVALSRALVRKPQLLLLDEPLSALDTTMRSRLQDYIMQFHQQFNLTTLLVSHDLPEVMKMSKRVLVLENGTVRLDGSPELILTTGNG